MIGKQYNVNQLRIDLWHELNEQSSQIVLRLDSPSFISRFEVLKTLFKDLCSIEQYYAFPSSMLLNPIEKAIEIKDYVKLNHLVSDIVSQLNNTTNKSSQDANSSTAENKQSADSAVSQKKSFEVLYVENLTLDEKESAKKKWNALKNIDEDFVYDILVQPSFQDALISVLFNYSIQAVVISNSLIQCSSTISETIKPFIQSILKIDLEGVTDLEIGQFLEKHIRQLRPELDIYFILDSTFADNDINNPSLFRQIYHQKEDLQALHSSIIEGIKERYETPFYTALKEYSKRPMTVFHALPISRGNSIFNSQWISDFGEFYGKNIFLAETSATNGGLDSLLQPTGPMKKAQEKAAKAFGAQHTFFVTNGTSTSNKIVQQAIITPGDVVLVNRDCHKSHHYGLVLAGAFPAYLNSYPIEEYSMYGAVPLVVIKEKLLDLKKVGRLDTVKMLLLTNCTFDGVVYNVEKVMEEVLAIKPDMVFLWDEAWFAFASFNPVYRQRTAMYVAQKLFDKYKTLEYRKLFNAHLASLKSGETATLPDPDKVKIRVYATQSTHKTLSSFRQGSMIHIWDEEFDKKVSDAFHESYMTHSTTSANYQIIASLDAGRRQVELEGYELVDKSIEMALVLRSKIHEHPKLSDYFSFLSPNDLIPNQFRSQKTKSGGKHCWQEQAVDWEKDEFVLDPTKITLSVGKAGISGDAFKNKYLMDRFNIQVNKTSRNTVLLIANIGTTLESVNYCINALLQIADELDFQKLSLNKKQAEIAESRIQSLIKDVPPLPNFSSFHSSFLAAPGIPGGNLREAFFLGYDEELCEYLLLEDCVTALANKQELVSTSFVIPYPPGFPILVPGQVVSKEILQFMLAIDVKEIHGYRADLGLKIFTKKALNRKNTISAMGAMHAMQALMGNSKVKLK